MLKLRYMENNHFFKILIFLFFLGFSKGLALNAQVKPNIEKHPLLSNGAKTWLEEFKFECL